MHAMLKGGMGGLIQVIDDDNDELPQVEEMTNSNDEEEFSNNLRRNLRDTTLFADAEIKTSDPSQFFEIKHEN